MPFFSPGISWNVTARDIPEVTSNGEGAAHELINGVPVRGQLRAADGAGLVVQFRLENSAGQGVTVEIDLTDPSGQRGFVGQGIVTWPEGESEPVQLEFRDFRAGPGGEPAAACDYEMSLINDESTDRVTLRATVFPG